MYHGMQSELGARHPYDRDEHQPAAKRFAAYNTQLLHDNGYSTVGSLHEALEFMKITGRNGGKRVVITFDHGFADFTRTRFPSSPNTISRRPCSSSSGLTGNETVVAWKA